MFRLAQIRQRFLRRWRRERFRRACERFRRACAQRTALVTGCLYYWSFILLCMGILPLSSPSWKNHLSLWHLWLLCGTCVVDMLLIFRLSNCTSYQPVVVHSMTLILDGRPVPSDRSGERIDPAAETLYGRQHDYFYHWTWAPVYAAWLVRSPFMKAE